VYCLSKNEKSSHKVEENEYFFWEFARSVIAVLWHFISFRSTCTTPDPSRGWGRGVSYSGPCDVWGAPRSARNIMYARMYHFEKKSSKILSPEGPRKNVSPGPFVALDGPAQAPLVMH